MLKEAEHQYELGLKKHDFFVPIPVIEGLVSAKSLQNQGTQIHSLASKKIYPMYGVWTPTTQEYLNLFGNYLAQNKSHYSRKQTCVDLGCGTGVLPIVLAEEAGFDGHIYSIDN